MSDLERTPAGLQMVIPGCERRTLPRSTTRVDDIGQGLLSFYRPASLREKLANRADAPLRPSKGQKALPKSGLFGSQIASGHPLKKLARRDDMFVADRSHAASPK